MAKIEALSVWLMIAPDSVCLDKEDDGGRWILTCALPNTITLRLRITVGGPWDWFYFVAEAQRVDPNR
jgi:hypothetical protein